VIKRIQTLVVLVCFACNLGLPSASFAAPQTLLNLPSPEAMITVSLSYAPTTLKGVKIYPNEPLRFDFVVDTGDAGLKGQKLIDETTKLVKYFLASLALPEKDLWVNLSPYEKDHIVSKDFGMTAMGTDLLAQDYILKQLTSSLIYPEGKIGQEFWQKIYKKAYEQFGTTKIPINTFNKVWIVPEKAVVYQNGNTAIIASSHLKVMLEEDYLALNKNINRSDLGLDTLNRQDASEASKLSSRIIREVVIPVLEKEVNEGKNFAPLRQIYQSHILASWYKKALKKSFLGRVYSNSSKVQGIDIEDKEAKIKIYEQYVKAFKTGVYNYIREEFDQHTQQVIPRKYFSGGMRLPADVDVIASPAQLSPGERNRVVENAGKTDIAPYVLEPLDESRSRQEGAFKQQLAKLGFSNFQKIARGNKSVVFKADGPMGQGVVVKVQYSNLPADLHYPFPDVDEINRVRDLLGEGHPNVEKILQAGQIKVDDQDYKYVVTENVPGRNLEDYFNSLGHALPFDGTMQIIEGIMAGYEYMRSKGVIRNAPSLNNIVLNEDTHQPVHVDYLGPVDAEASQRAAIWMRDLLLHVVYGFSPIADSAKWRSYKDRPAQIVEPRYGRTRQAAALSDLYTEITAQPKQFSDPEFLYGRLRSIQTDRAMLALAMRDISAFESGAFTGQNSKQLARDVGVSYVVIEEPRVGTALLTGEDNEDIALKIDRVLKGDGPGSLKPIIRLNVSLADIASAQDGKAYYDQLAQKLKGLIKHADRLKDVSIVLRFSDDVGLQEPAVLKKSVDSIRSTLKSVISGLGISHSPEAHDQIRILLGGASIHDRERIELFDGVYIGPETSVNEGAVLQILNTVNDIQSSSQNTGRKTPLVVVDMTKIYGDSLVSRTDALKKKASELKGIEITAVATNLDLRRAGQVITGNALDDVVPLPKPSNVHFAAQALEDMSPEYLQALKKDGTTYVLLHHSERRRYHGLTIEQAAIQVRAVYDAGLIPVIAIGELDRTAGWDADLAHQTRTVLEQFTLEELKSSRKPRFAYEPIAYIGSGQTMSTLEIAQANEIIVATIEKYVQEKGGQPDEVSIGILYGGSVKPSSAYGQSGGWERSGKVPRILRRLKDTIGALVGTRSLIPGDPDRIGDRFSESAERFGKTKRGETGLNWKMNVHTLEDAVRRIDEFVKFMDKDGRQWKGEYYFAVPSSMIEPLARRYRGENGPRQIATLDRTNRQKQMARAIDQFWTEWENSGMDSSLESLDGALTRLYLIYREDKPLKAEGVTFYELYEKAILSELFADKKTVIPAAQLLVRFRFAPLKDALAEINDPALRNKMNGIFGDKKYMRELTAEQVGQLIDVLSGHFKLSAYEKVILEHVIPESVRKAVEQSATERLDENIAILETEKLGPDSYKAIINALWRIRDVIVFDYKTTGLKQRGLVAITAAEEKFGHSTLILKTITEIQSEAAEAGIVETIEGLEASSPANSVPGYEQRIVLSLDSLKSDILRGQMSKGLRRRSLDAIASVKARFSDSPIIQRKIEESEEEIAAKPAEDAETPLPLEVLHRLQEMAQIYSDDQFAATIQKLTDAYKAIAAGMTPERIDEVFASIQGEDQELVYIDQLRDVLAMERAPQNFVRRSQKEYDDLIREVNFARIWGGIRPYLAYHAKENSRVQQTKKEAPGETGLSEYKPIGKDPVDRSYDLVVARPVDIALDVSGAFDGTHELSLRTAADNFMRQIVGDRKGQGFNPNFNLQEIYGIGSLREFLDFINFIAANPYHGRAKFQIQVVRKFDGQSAAIRLKSIEGISKNVIVRKGISYKETARGPLTDIIVLTDQDPDKLQMPDNPSTTFHVVNPLLDSTQSDHGGGNIKRYNTGISDSLGPILKVLDDKYGISNFSFELVTPGERHNLQSLGNYAGRGIQWLGMTAQKITGQPHWESHAQQGAGFVQIYVTLKEGQTVDKEAVTKRIMVADMAGEPVHFSNGWIPNSLSVQAHDKPLVLDRNISVQGGKFVTLRAWVPDWTQSRNVLDSLLKQRVAYEAEPAGIRSPVEGERLKDSAMIGIYGGDEVVAGRLLQQFKGNKNVIVRSIYIEETTENPLEVEGFAKFLRQIMPGATIVIGPEGDNIRVNDSSPVKVHIGKGKIPQWDEDGVDTVIVTQKWARDNKDTRDMHERKGAKQVIVAVNPQAAVDHVVGVVASAFRDQKIEGRIVHSNTALDPFRDRGHDIIVGSEIKPAPFANLIPKVSAEGYLNIESSQYDANITAVTFILDREMGKEEVLRRLGLLADDPAKDVVLLDKDIPLRPSLFVGDQKLYINPENVIVKGKTVTVLVGYDYADVWAKTVIDHLNVEAPELSAPEQVERKPAKKPVPASELKKTNIVDYIPAPLKRPVKTREIGQEYVHRLAVDLSAQPNDEQSRDPLDYFAGSLVDVLMGDERVAVSLYGVKNIIFLLKSIRKRLPEHVQVALDGFAEHDLEKYQRDLNDKGHTFLIIDGVKIKVSAKSILDNPEELDRDSIDSLMVVTDEKESDVLRKTNGFKGKYNLHHLDIVNPKEDGLAWVRRSFELILRSRAPVNNVRIVETKPGRLTEHEVSQEGDIITVRTPTRLEGNLQDFIVEFGQDVSREQIESMIDDFQRWSGVRITVTNKPLTSLDIVNNPQMAVISKMQITGSGRLWSVSIWSGETGLAQQSINALFDRPATDITPIKSKIAMAEGVTRQRLLDESQPLPTFAPIASKPRHKKLAVLNAKADLIISAIGGESGKAMLLATIGDPNVNILGVTLNKPDEPKVKATIEAMNNSTNYGQPGIRFEYGGYDEEARHFVMYAGTDETGWARIPVYNGEAKSIPIRKFVGQGNVPVYLHMAGSGYHRYKEKGWSEAGAIVQWGNPGKGERLLLIPGAADWEDPELAEKIRSEEIDCVGSCTTGSAVGALAAVRENQMFEYVSGITLHEFTNDQNINDGPMHDVDERAFSAARTTSLSTSGAGATVGEAMKAFSGLSTAVALREGFGGASVYQGVVKIRSNYKNTVDLEFFKQSFRQTALRNPGVVAVHEGPYSLDSDLVKGTSISAYIDLTTMRYDAQKGDLYFDSWYDNVLGFSTRMIQVAEDTSAIRKSDHTSATKEGAASEGRFDTAMTVDPGGIDLGQGNYLEVVDYTKEGAPRFEPAQLKMFERNFIGVVPVPILSPVPVNIFLLSGLSKSDKQGPEQDSKNSIFTTQEPALVLSH